MTASHFKAAIPLALSLLFWSCGNKPDTAIDITSDGKMPPSFSFSGPWWARDFQVYELPPHSLVRNGKDSPQLKKIWLITLGYDQGKRATEFPTIIYGIVPNGFTQQIPAEGSPPPLVEGKLYVAQALDNALNGGAYHFVIRNGSPVRVSPEDVFTDTADNSNVAR